MGCRIAPELVSDQLPGRFFLALQQLAKEALSRFLVSTLRDQDVENITVLIDCEPEIHLLSLDLYEGFIDVPSVAQPAPLPSDFPGVLRPELRAPEPDGFVRNGDSTLCQQILDVTKAQSKTVIKSHRTTNDFCREAMTFVEGIHPVIFSCPNKLTVPILAQQQLPEPRLIRPGILHQFW